MTDVKVERDRNGWIAGLVVDGRTLTIHRDRNGFLEGIEGPAPAVQRDPLLDQVVGVTADLYGRVSALEGREDAVPDIDGAVKRVLALTAGEHVSQIDDHVAKAQATVTVAESTVRQLRSAAQALRDQELEAAGWVNYGRLLVNRRNANQAIRWLGLRCHVRLEWCSPNDSKVAGSYMFDNDAQTHIINVRHGMTAELTATTIAHELFHASQAEELQKRFGQVYEACQAELEAEAREGAERICELFELARAA